MRNAPHLGLSGKARFAKVRSRALIDEFQTEVDDFFDDKSPLDLSVATMSAARFTDGARSSVMGFRDETTYDGAGRQLTLSLGSDSSAVVTSTDPIGRSKSVGAAESDPENAIVPASTAPKHRLQERMRALGAPATKSYRNQDASFSIRRFAIGCIIGGVATAAVLGVLMWVM